MNYEATLKNVEFAVRVRLHLMTGVTVVFLSIYGKVVCPFIDTLTFGRILYVLGIIYFFQILARELLYLFFPTPALAVSTSRHGFHISVLTWLLAGVAASLLHSYLYTDFHWASHLKLLSGYWGLGAGILSQLEYVALEKHFRELKTGTQPIVNEKITNRLMESFAVFTVVPALMMVLVSFRFVFEGFTNRAAAVEVLFLGGCFVVAGLFVSWQYGQALREDCDHLTEAVNEVSEGHFEINIDTSRSDDLGKVAKGINVMAHGLLLREKIRDAFGRFVNPEVADSFIKNFSENDSTIKMGGKRQEVAILMADIRGFTPISESMGPEEITILINGYFSEMVAGVQMYGGMVDKFIGDAIMVVFGLSEKHPNYAKDAVLAAIEMRRRLEIFNKAQAESGNQTIENGIGIHVGEVVAGYIGSKERLEFTVIGHAVNLAARIESQTKAPNPPILFSDTVAELIAKDIDVRQVAEVNLKGVSEQTILYTVM
ncbi:MAG: adenylate/guanylate cyclase domain-containing protein [Magnetococcales bacterium]|nr:adenylate/guanylate cyclase domain-containing protein [Magnetococcales bacterium]